MNQRIERPAGEKAATNQIPRGRYWTRFLDRRLQIFLDLIVLAGAFWAAYLLRFDFQLPRPTLRTVLLQLPLVVLLEVAVQSILGIYNFVWRYVGISELRTFVAASLCSTVPLFVLRFALPEGLREWRIPISITLINSVVAFMGTVGLRIARRYVHEHYERSPGSGSSNGRAHHGKPVLLVGAGQAGILAARELARRGDLALEVKGFVDDHPDKKGTVISGVKVLGATGDLPRLVWELEIDHVIITIATATRNEIRRIVEICERIPVRVQIIPGFYEILEGRVKVSEIRDVQIEDLLGRAPVRLDEDGIRTFLAGKVVMVTGAGGSIGSELVRQVARFGPSKLLLVERTEFALYLIDEEMNRCRPDVTVVPLLADVCDRQRMRDVFGAFRPQVVFHAAAHKHVPLMETNAGEAVKNNILGTNVVGEVAGEYGTETFVLISTDKAVNPTSVMGATKRAAEMVMELLDHRFATVFVAVRFGNVLGSTGSVIPRFREQIARGGPVTVTHPEMKRYFMTIPEATQLVLQAGAQCEGGEIFILDMGEPVKIVDLARDMISLSGFKPSEDIDIVFTGVRPGEKLFEELGTSNERVERTRHEKVFVGKIPAISPEVVLAAIKRLDGFSKDGDEKAVREELGRMVPEAQLSPGAEESRGIGTRSGPVVVALSNREDVKK